MKKAKKKSKKTKRPEGNKGRPMSGERIANIEEFSESLSNPYPINGNLTEVVRQVRHFEHPSGCCLVPVNITERIRNLLTGELMNLPAGDVALLPYLIKDIVLNLPLDAIHLFDAADDDFMKWAEEGFLDYSSRHPTINEYLIMQAKWLAVAMDERSQIIADFDRYSSFEEPQKNTFYKLSQAVKDMNILLGWIRDKIELQRQEMNLPCDLKNIQIRFADFLGEQEKIKPAPKIVTASLIKEKYHVTISTLRRAIQDQRLTDHRPEDKKRSTSQLLLDENEVADRWPKKNTTPGLAKPDKK